jgi:cytochrome c oxidase assembly protein subunit 15
MVAQKSQVALVNVVLPVKIWLLIGLVMVFIQVVVGGITRLTDSGLSITEWAVIQGTIPPLNETQWLDAFEKYKIAARKQFESLHANMTLSEFKVIFFWEYIHRLWARLMGFVFLVPFLYFLTKKWIPQWLLKRLGVVILLAATAATFGWIMVASGLNDDTRTWVSAYKLMGHLLIATSLFAYLFWTYLLVAQPKVKDAHLVGLRKLGWGVAVVLVLQIAFGALMAGMRAALIHPSFPMFVEGERLWNALTVGVNVDSFVDYEKSTYAKAIVQIIHRTTAYLLVGFVIYFLFQLFKQNISTHLKNGGVVLASILGVQFLLGVLTIVNSIGRVPIAYGVLHQAVALLLLVALLYVIYQVTPKVQK